MIDPEYPAEKNEEELNLFADQPGVEDTPATPENTPDDDNMKQAQETSAGTGNDIPVVAPPPRRQPSTIRPGIVSPLAGQAAGSSAPAASAATAANTHKPLPHPLQQSQSLGQMLSSIRNARGLSAEEVCIATRIRMEYLVELEADELLKTLPHVYVSAYVRKLIEVYDLSREDADVLLEKMHGETPQDAEDLPEKLIESVNDGALVNEGENKRIRNITIVFFIAIGIVAAAILWLVILVFVHYAKTPDTGPGHRPSTEISGSVQPAEAPVSQTILLDESELDALIVPETPSISVLKMSKTPGVRDTP